MKLSQCCCRRFKYGKYHHWLCLIAVIASVAFRVGLSEFLIIAALFLLLAVPSFRRIFIAGSTTYVLTNYRLGIFTVGFGQKERFIPLEHIQTVVTRSSFLQRFYGAGDIVIKLKGLLRIGHHDRADGVQAPG